MSTQRSLLVLLGVVSVLSVAMVQTPSAPPAARRAESAPFPAGWEQVSQREEIRPAFSFDPRGGPGGSGAFVITTADSVGQHGWCQKAYPIIGGKSYRFQAARRTDNV
jgi:hypothetical protein